MSETRRRNFKLFAFLAERCSDAELRTLAECVQDELDFREDRFSRQPEEPIREEHAPRAPHRNHSVERVERVERERPRQARATRAPSGTRPKQATGTDGH